MTELTDLFNQLNSIPVKDTGNNLNIYGYDLNNPDFAISSNSLDLNPHKPIDPAQMNIENDPLNQIKTVSVSGPQANITSSVQPDSPQSDELTQMQLLVKELQNKIHDLESAKSVDLNPPPPPTITTPSDSSADLSFIKTPQDIEAAWKLSDYQSGSEERKQKLTELASTLGLSHVIEKLNPKPASQLPPDLNLTSAELQQIKGLGDATIVRFHQLSETLPDNCHAMVLGNRVLFYVQEDPIKNLNQYFDIAPTNTEILSEAYANTVSRYSGVFPNPVSTLFLTVQYSKLYLAKFGSLEGAFGK